MDAVGTSAPPSDLKNSAMASGGEASKLLANLPSRGLFTSSTVLCSNPGGMRVYICDHDTSPPVDQVIRTNQTNILIRSLLIKNQKGNSGTKDGKGTATGESSRKRAAGGAADGRASSKKALTQSQAGSRQEGSRSRGMEKELQNLTVEKLRALLKEKGLSPKGKKEELIARLKGVNG